MICVSAPALVGDLSEHGPRGLLDDTFFNLRNFKNVLPVYS